jgi:uncharacterized membrane protein
MAGWGEFGLALAAFAATHFLPTRRGLRDRLIAALGRRTYFTIYGVFSLLALGWAIAAAGRAPYVALWGPAEWQRWITFLTMPVALMLAALGVGARYPYTLGGRGGRFDPAAPGIAAATRHPLLWALALWALAHLPPNGNFAHVILFGGFAALALGAMPLFDRRAQRTATVEEWRAIARATALLSLAPVASAAWRRENARDLGRAAAVAAGLFLLLFVLHEPVIGVSPAPR